MPKGPVIEKYEIVPVAGNDSMLLTLSGAHAPHFTRNIVILTDSAGHEGIGEIHGGESIQKSLESYRDLVIGKHIVDYRQILNSVRQVGYRAKGDSGAGLQSLDLANLKYVVHAEAALECALLDLYGKWVDLPMCDIIGNGRQRDTVEMLGYLFFIADKNKAQDLDYIDSEDTDDWGRIRREPALTPDAIVREALAAQKRYGFHSFKLKGGVLPGEQEMQVVDALHEAFPDCRINIDPNGAWSLNEAIRLVNAHRESLTYVEDPCGPESGFSGREIMSFFKNATNMPVATNMIATDWKQFYPSVLMKSVDIVLADPHFWGISGALRMADILDTSMLTWGSHSNNHFDITLALFAQTAAAAPGKITAIDTHYIWQDGQELCNDAMQIRDGKIRIPDKPGLGITLDHAKLKQAHELYKRMKNHDRDDAMAMQYLISDWKFDPNRPTLDR